MIKRIAILGSTGSIGTNTLRVIEALGCNWQLTAISGHSNIELLAAQANKFTPETVALTGSDGAGIEKLHELLNYSPRILTGPESLCDIAEIEDVDIIIASVVGAAGLPAVIKAVENGKTIAIANKEPLVIAGEIVTRLAKDNGATILPVDSEHSALFQSLQAGKTEHVKKLILTASGGPFRNATPDEIRNVKYEDALQHPTWQMGPKITVDSATMANKALEIIEAVHLFGLPVDKIEVLIHPESIVHSMVEFDDNSVIAQMSQPDMCLPIQYALTYPDRLKGLTEPLQLHKIEKLTFSKPDLEVFPALRLGMEAARLSGSAPVVFNAANEAAVTKFLDKKMPFHMIPEIIEHCMNKHDYIENITLEQIYSTDAWARAEVNEILVNKPHGIIR